MRPIKISLPTQSKSLTDDDAMALMNSVKWYHAFELRPGLKTPGEQFFYPESAADGLGIPRDLSGKTALDIGAWDGPMTFELERRGAKTRALDIQDPTRVGFDVARQILGSQVTHYEGSVYQLPFGELKDLDVVVFRGVFYHLKYRHVGESIKEKFYTVMPQLRPELRKRFKYLISDFSHQI